MRAADNPFAVHRVLRQRYRLTEGEWSALLQRLDSLRSRAAIVGPHGSGKTTLLEDLAERLRARGRRVRALRCDATLRRLEAIDDLHRDDLIFVDGAEQLSRVDWWRLLLLGRSGGLVITSHREEMLPTLHRCATSPELLRDLCSGMGVTLSPGRCVELHERHRGNVRDALRQLYDESAMLAGTAALA